MAGRGPGATVAGLGDQRSGCAVAAASLAALASTLDRSLVVAHQRGARIPAARLVEIDEFLLKPNDVALPDVALPD